MNVDTGMIEQLKTTDSPRTTMLAIIGSLKVAPQIKALAYMLVNTARDAEIEKLRAMFITACGYLGKNDIQGLIAYLSSLGINPWYFNGVLFTGEESAKPSPASPTYTGKNQ